MNAPNSGWAVHVTNLISDDFGGLSKTITERSFGKNSRSSPVNIYDLKVSRI